MTKLSRLIHIYVSLFFLPMALLFALSGALFIFGVDAEFGAKYQHYTLEKEITKGQEAEAMLEFLHENNIALPKNQPADNKDENVLASLGTLHYNAFIKEISPNVYEISTQKRSFLGVLMGLHEAKDSSIFDILAIGFALTLFVLYITGVIITLLAMSKNKRKSQYLALGAGIFVCVFVGCLKVFAGI